MSGRPDEAREELNDRIDDAAWDKRFSVHQTDIIHYGFDLADYLRNEFHLPGHEEGPRRPRTIQFWDNFLS